MDMKMLRQYQGVTRYLRPVKPVEFTDREMLQTIARFLDLNDIVSCARLLGDRKGVIRVTFKSDSGAEKLEEMIGQHKLKLQTVTLGLVDEKGLFFVLSVENVPHFVTDDELEGTMAKFGQVAGSTREFIEYKGTRVENEKRCVLFTTLYSEQNLMPRELRAFGTMVYMNFLTSCKVCHEYDGTAAVHDKINHDHHQADSLKCTEMGLQADPEQSTTSKNPSTSPSLLKPVQQLNVNSPPPQRHLASDNSQSERHLASSISPPERHLVVSSSPPQRQLANAPSAPQRHLASYNKVNLHPGKSSIRHSNHPVTRRASVNVVFHHREDDKAARLSDEDDFTCKTPPLSPGVIGKAGCVADAQQIRANAMMHLERQINS